ncbi:MAG: SCO family protein [Akkermansiaceae bacterium]
MKLHLIAAHAFAFSVFTALTVLTATAESFPDVTDTTVPPFPNQEVLNMEGETIKFYDDLVKNKVVAINFVFSSCPSICPVMQVKFSQIQKDLIAAGTKDVQFISVSIDPVTDTPERLKAWSKDFGANDQWEYITGEKDTIDHILKKLEVFTADINDHPSFILIGNDKKGVWKRVNSLAPVKILTEEILQLK